ncbi:sterol desaturase family protein [Ruegeria sp. Ofav3-42]|uniref:sterol desaturase family protein n=1 Tax=Ruegeria sp. Ofav3-42 TaxID=2917759 RepID=UPI001EF6C758|nr:sterol desaturase family protein [Ruegeria sp. Ofav3-42]MCG7520775.1 sterol desaturase family protein [Ruegeria sp. Ofav3-42]
MTVLIALVWLVAVRRSSLKRALHQIFDRKILFSASAKADYKIFLINRVFTLFISPLLVSQLAIATALFYALHNVDFLQRGAFSDAPTGVIVALFTITIFVVDDFTKYLLHRWMHHWPLLWAIHKTHHSAETMTPITVYRTHPLEGILFSLRSAVAQGTTMAVFLFLFGNAVDLYTVLGVNVMSFVFHVTGSNLRHSHISIRYWAWLEHILISPAQHQVHHSIAREHHDKNFGVALAVWDWLFGSLHLSERDADLKFGLQPSEAHPSRLLDIYLRPFADMARIVKRRLGKLRINIIRRSVRHR